MKRIVTRVAVLALTALFFASCSPEKFEPEFLHSDGGHWTFTRQIDGSAHNMHQRFYSDGMGKEWDTTDGMSEGDALKFKWTMNGSQLEYLHELYMGGGFVDRESYTVLSLTATTLRMKDDVDGTVINAAKQ